MSILGFYFLLTGYVDLSFCHLNRKIVTANCLDNGLWDLNCLIVRLISGYWGVFGLFACIIITMGKILAVSVCGVGCTLKHGRLWAKR